MNKLIIRLILVIPLFFAGCKGKQNSALLGSRQNPVKFYFTPSVDATVISKASTEMMAFLKKETGYEFKTGIPSSYITVIESLGSERADVAIINSFGYLLAHSKYEAEARLRLIRFGEPTYRGQIIAHVNSGINNLKDIHGKRFAFVDASSTSGYMFPLKLLKELNIIPSQTVFAMKHDNVVTMVYQQQVDAGATYYSPPGPDGQIRDARQRVKTQFPDVEKKVKLIALTDPIPNDPVIFRKNMPEEIKTKIIAALIKYSHTDEGKNTLLSLYNIEGFIEAKDSDYNNFRSMVKLLDVDLNEMIK